MISQKDCLDSSLNIKCHVCKKSLDNNDKVYCLMLGDFLSHDTKGVGLYNLKMFWHNDLRVGRLIYFHETCFTLMAGLNYTFDIPEKK